MAVKDNVHLQMDFDEESVRKETFFEEANEDVDQSETEQEVFTMESTEIKRAFNTLKHAMQLNGLRFEDLDQYLFGTNYKPEQRVVLSELIQMF